MKSLLKTLLILVAIISFSSCDLGTDEQQTCLFYEGSAATAVSGPETAAVNQEITLNVSFTTRENCGSFYSFYEVADVNNVNSITITVNSRIDGCDCSKSTTKTAPYKFKALTAGVYVLKFKKSNDANDVIIKTITVS